MPNPIDTSSTLEDGQIFLHYKIERRLGAGGMGEVYLASDTKLGRKVALKILPIDRTKSPDSLARFEQEARTASALNHPNIAHIYEIGESDGLHFIAMEYVEGVSLEDKIGGHPLTTSETVRIGREIADALDEAHAQGIVHRDIKPANVMIDRRNRVKVLDFGLAKFSQSISSEDSTAVKTRSGVVMGTASYMSPEQALGRETDARADLWSLGVILYEMTTGRLPFHGESITETIDKITHAQPEAIARFNYDVPAELEVIIKKALRKAPDERYQSAHDLLVDLKSLSNELDLAEHSTAPGFRGETDGNVSSAARTGEQATQTLIRNRTTEDAQAKTVRRTSSAEYIVGEIKRHKTGVIVAIAGLFVLIVGGFGLYRYSLSGRAASSPKDLKFVRLTNGGKHENEYIVGGATISPDGKRVVFWTEKDGKSSCWVRQVSANTTVRVLGPIEGTQGGTTFSPDGEFIYYNGSEKSDPRQYLYQIPAMGGTPRRILEGVSSAISFSPDGKRIAFVKADPDQTMTLMTANSDGSEEPRTLATRNLPEYFSTEGPSWSPDGKVIATGAGVFSEKINDATIIEVPAGGGAERVIASSRWNYVGRVIWLPDGSGLAFDAYANPLSTGTQLWFVSYPDGAAHRITNDLNGYGTVSLGLTADAKTIVTVQEDFSGPIYAIGPNDDPSHAKQISYGKYEGMTGLSVAPNGKLVYCDHTGDNNDIWIMNGDGSDRKQLTNDQFIKVDPQVSPDGRYVVFSSDRSGGVTIWRMDIDGNNLKQLTPGGKMDAGAVFSPDGQWVIFHSVRSGKNTLWKVSIDGGTPAQLVDKVSWHAAVSPDGKTIASFFADDKGKTGLGLLSFDGGDFLKTFDLPDSVETSGGIKWTPDGRSLTFINSRNDSNIVSLPIAGGSWKPLTSFKSDRIYKFTWTRDGKQIVYSRGPFIDDVVLIKDFR